MASQREALFATPLVALLAARLVTARYFAEQILPGAVARKSTVTAGVDDTLALDSDCF